MIQFLDQNNNKVELSFSKSFFSEEVKHVLTICQYGNRWLLTRHKLRGLEFPGGKVEPNESLEEAARRETFEETGAILSELQFVAEYKVYDKKGAFVKAVFWGKVSKLDQTGSYHETNGPVLAEDDLLQLRFGDQYSFIMKDQVIAECMNYIKKLQKGIAES